MRKLCYIFLFISGILAAQDKLYFKNGTLRKGTILSTGKEFVFFKTNDTSAVEKFSKSELVMVETYNGTRMLFKQETKKDSTKPVVAYRNSFGIQPLDIFVGRATLAYEKFTSDQKIGVVIPLSITFDPNGLLYGTRLDTSANALKRIPGINFISGADVNFYFGKRNRFRFFVGPRFRYGTDVFLSNVEAYSLQTQLGWKIGGHDKRLVQNFSVGYGFVKLVKAPGATAVNLINAYPWASINYRVGLNW